MTFYTEVVTSLNNPNPRCNNCGMMSVVGACVWLERS